jgi:GNAT superfamily N-acetyltransferase
MRSNLPGPQPSFEVRRLEPSDDRSGFRSGDLDLDRFFQKYAGQNQFRHHIGTTYIALMRGAVVGYTTVSSCHVAVDGLPASKKKRLPRYPLPVLRLARLAVDQNNRGKGIGLALLKAVFTIAREMERLAGCVGVVVDAKPGAVEFYRRFGFEEVDEVLEGECDVRPIPVTMFLPLERVPAAAR